MPGFTSALISNSNHSDLFERLVTLVIVTCASLPCLVYRFLPIGEGCSNSAANIVQYPATCQRYNVSLHMLSCVLTSQFTCKGITDPNTHIKDSSCNRQQGEGKIFVSIFCFLYLKQSTGFARYFRANMVIFTTIT